LFVCLSCLSVTLVYCGQTIGRIKMKLGMQVGLGPGHIVLDGDPAPLPQGGRRSPQVLAHICCGQMAAGIKVPLSMEVELGPGDSVLDGDSAPPPQKGAESPKFSSHVYCGETAGWMKLVVGMEIGLSPGVCVRWGSSSPPQKGGRAPSPIFGPFLLWPNGWTVFKKTCATSQKNVKSHVFWTLKKRKKYV